MKINRIAPENHPYLQIVTSIAKPPEKLYFLGTLPVTRRPSVAIVGTRKPTAYGREVTDKLASELARKGVVIISGLALGVDAIAQKAALDAHGTTLGVLANGLPDIRPATNRQLGERIINNGGALLSEFGPDYVVGKWSFLMRNRIVAGLADAIIITEANSRSGTLNTAAAALEQGKTVFVVPGNITSPMSSGCNTLLKQGATPITAVEDVLEIIAPDLIAPQTSMTLGSNQLETTILSLINAGVRDGDIIQQQSGVSATDLNIALTMLELNGAVRPLGANQWSLK